MICIDKTGHLTADTLNELHLFAESIGIKRGWFHNPRGKNHPHYDLVTENKRNKALSNGAKLVSSKDIVKISKKCK